MTKLFSAILFALILTAAAFGQTKVSSGAQLELKTKPRIAVLEFAAQPNTSAVGGVQTLQNGIVQKMAKKEGHKDWIELPSTSVQVRDLYKQFLGQPVDSGMAAKIGKTLGVEYVMTGSYAYDHKLGGGSFVAKSEIVEVATGKIIWSGQTTQTGLTKAGTGTLVLTSANVLPTIQKLTASLKAADL